MEPSLLCMEPVQRVLEASRQMAYIVLGTGAASDRSEATPSRERRFTLPALGTAASLVAVRAFFSEHTQYSYFVHVLYSVHYCNLLAILFTRD